jgi:hypothetical protein
MGDTELTFADLNSTASSRVVFAVDGRRLSSFVSKNIKHVSPYVTCSVKWLNQKMLLLTKSSYHVSM